MHTSDPTFCDLPAATLETLGDAQVAILGASHATPYSPGTPSHSSGAPAALRSALEWYDTRRDHIDMDRGTPLMGAARVVDIGDVDTNLDDAGDTNRAAIREAVAAVRARGAAPIILGGDDSVPIPFFEGFAGEEVWIVQIDAHIDWRNEVEGVTHGFSSTMRRASEMEQVQGIVQIGARGVGSARAGEVEVAKAWGAKLFPMRQIHAEGLAPALAAVPEGANIILTIDVDGLDPALCPAALSSEFGGIDYHQMLDIIEGCGARGRIVGATMIEFVPDRDPRGLAAKAVARILCNLIAEIGAQP